jgi:hypothetical protein
MPNTSIADRLRTWQTCTQAMAPRLGDFEFLRDEHTELSSILAEVQQLLVEEDRHEGELRKAVRRRQQLDQRGRDLYGRIDVGLRSHFGKKSQELRQFGLEPLAEPRRRGAAETPPPPAGEEPPPPEPPAPAAGEGG